MRSFVDLAMLSLFRLDGGADEEARPSLSLCVDLCLSAALGWEASQTHYIVVFDSVATFPSLAAKPLV